MAKQVKDVIAKYRSPWSGGVVARRNALDLQPNEFPFLNNVILFGDIISNRPFLIAPTGAFQASTTDPPNIIIQDPSGAFASYLTPAAYWDQNAPFPGPFVHQADYGAGISLLSNDAITVNGVCYFCTNNIANHGFLSTISSGKVLVQNAATYVGGRWIGEQANHILLADCFDNAGNHNANRLSWSAENLPLVWDPTVNTNAGFIDIVDINDSITGLVNVDIYTYLLRTFGVSLVTPTGNGILPFSVQHLTNPPYQGRGNFWSGSLDGDGNIAVYVSNTDVEMLSSNGISQIGGDAAPAIFKDLKATLQNIAPIPYFNTNAAVGRFAVIGSLLPGLDYDYPYPMYILTIPNYTTSGTQSNPGSIWWICDLKSLAWTRHVVPNIIPTTKIKIGIVQDQPGVVNLSQYIPLFGAYNKNAGVLSYGIVPFSTNPTYEGTVTTDTSTGELDFRTENLEGMWGTIRNIRIYYQDTDPAATITCTLTGVNESGGVVTNSANFTTAGLQDDQIKQVMCPIELSCLLPQLKLTMPAGAAYSILGVDIIGAAEELEVL